MEEVQKTKADIRTEIANMIDGLPQETVQEKTKEIENRLFEFANFMESKIALLYISTKCEVESENILQRAYDRNKIVVLPIIDAESSDFNLYKIDDITKDLKTGAAGILQPDPQRCRIVPLECIDIAIIPGIAFDEKGGRIGPGNGYYDRLIPKLPITTRKVALALDAQVIAQVPTESHDKHVDIIITEKRIIYKI